MVRPWGLGFIPLLSVKSGQPQLTPSASHPSLLSPRAEPWPGLRDERVDICTGHAAIRLMTTPPAVRCMRNFVVVVTTWVMAGIALPSLPAQAKPVPTESSLVGEMRNYQDSLTGVVEALVMLGAVQGPPEGYADEPTAKAAATASPGVEAIVRTSSSTYKLYAVRLIKNTPENTDRISRGEFSALTETELGAVDYRNLKCRFRHVEMNLDRSLGKSPGLINVVDPRGLYVASYKITPIGASADKILLMTLERELVNGNPLEAKEIYLFLEDRNAQQQHLPIVQATAQNYLRKFYQSGHPQLRVFAEAEMKRRGYSEPLINALKAGK